MIPDPLEPYSEALKEIERSRDTSRELTKSSFTSWFPKDPWEQRINKSKSIRSYMGAFWALKSVSPNTFIHPKKMKPTKSTHGLKKLGQNELILITKEEEDSLRGKDVESAVELLKMMHSPKTAPTMEVNLKYSPNKSATNMKQESIDELHLYDKINKLKSYYKSAQGHIANEMSRKAHRSRIDKMSSPNLTRWFSENASAPRRHLGYDDESVNSPEKDTSIQMFGSFQQNLCENQQTTAKDHSISKVDSQLPAIKEGTSTTRPSIYKQPPKIAAKFSLKAVLKEKLKNHTIHHKNIIDAYFKKDRNSVPNRRTVMFKSFG
jgi:hypothetical protein